MNSQYHRIAVLGIVLLFSTSAKAALIHSYSFTGNAQDETGSAHGTVSGATLTADRFGNANSAYSFDGNDSVQAVFSSSATMSYSVWGSSSNFVQNPMLFNTGSSGSGPDLFFVGSACGPSISWNTWDSCANDFGPGIPANLTDGNFHHYVLVNDQAGSVTSLYIDSILFGTAAFRPSGNIFTIGSSAAASGAFAWQGFIDDVRVYDHALVLADVQMLFNESDASPVPAPTPLLLLGLGFALIRFKPLRQGCAGMER